MTLRTAALLLCCTLSGTGYSTTLSGVSQQPSTPQADANQQPEQTKPTLRPNPDANGIYHTGDGVTVPKLIYSEEPEFSEQARKRKIGGNVLVQFIVETDGSVRDVHVVRSAADKYTKKKDHEAALTLDPKAVEAVSKYRFNPATLQGKPVPVELKVEVNFQIF